MNYFSGGYNNPLNYYNQYPYNGYNNNQFISPNNLQGYGNPQQGVNATPQPVPNVLNGKIVDSEDVVKATEVPIGGYGIFPKADLSEIYIKSWNNNGTTSIITFKPHEENKPIETKSNNGDLMLYINGMAEQIKRLELKLDAVLGKEQPMPQIASTEQRPQPKEVHF